MTLSNLPNMMPEVVEAVHLMHEDNPDVELDCMLYLKRIVADDPKMSSSVLDWFDEQERCNVCGERLATYTYNEPHPELDGHPHERLIATMCPKCDFSKEVIK